MEEKGTGWILDLGVSLSKVLMEVEKEEVLKLREGKRYIGFEIF